MRGLRWQGRMAALFEARSFGRFLVVGGLNTMVAFGGFPLLYLTLGRPVGYLPILVFCSLFNPVFSFVMHRYVTFASRGPAGAEIGRYLLVSLAAFLASWVFLASIDGWSTGWFVLAQVGFSIVLTIVNFAIVRRFVFRHSAAQP